MSWSVYQEIICDVNVIAFSNLPRGPQRLSPLVFSYFILLCDLYTILSNLLICLFLTHTKSLLSPTTEQREKCPHGLNPCTETLRTSGLTVKDWGWGCCVTFPSDCSAVWVKSESISHLQNFLYCICNTEVMFKQRCRGQLQLLHSFFLLMGRYSWEVKYWPLWTVQKAYFGPFLLRKKFRK